MIDTNKYEGHTPAPWEIHGDRICAQAACTPVDNVGGNIATVAHKGVLSDNEPNKQLIADAPLLFERVIHLEHILKCAKDVLTNIYTYDKDLEDAEWIAWFCDMEDEEE